MNVWAISDLHLSFARPEPRERYAARWRDHARKIESEWSAVVGVGDLVLLPGDVSIARNHRDVQPDLAWLDRLPGIKVISPGNHDRWWNGLEEIKPLLRRSICAVAGSAVEVAGVVVCGIKGAALPRDEEGAEVSGAVAAETESLNQALQQAAELGGGHDRPLYALIHYPPFDPHGHPGPWVGRLAQARARACVYGHLHIEGQWSRTPQGMIQGVQFRCVAADAVGFRPLRIDQLTPAMKSPPRLDPSSRHPAV